MLLKLVSIFNGSTRSAVEKLPNEFSCVCKITVLWHYATIGYNSRFIWSVSVMDSILIRVHSYESESPILKLQVTLAMSLYSQCIQCYIVLGYILVRNNFDQSAT